MTNAANEKSSSFLREWAGTIAIMVLTVLLLGAGVKYLDTYRIDNGSMEPNIAVGSRIFVQEGGSYELGDVITFRPYGGEVTTHRLVAYGDDGSLITKGDANEDPDVWDRPLTRDQVIGKVLPYHLAITAPSTWDSERTRWYLLAISLMLSAPLILLVGWARSRWSQKRSETTPRTPV